jgi:hypothetical protein
MKQPRRSEKKSKFQQFLKLRALRTKMSRDQPCSTSTNLTCLELQGEEGTAGLEALHEVAK